MLNFSSTPINGGNNDGAEPDSSYADMCDMFGRVSQMPGVGKVNQAKLLVWNTGGELIFSPAIFHTKRREELDAKAAPAVTARTGEQLSGQQVQQLVNSVVTDNTRKLDQADKDAVEQPPETSRIKTGLEVRDATDKVIAVLEEGMATLEAEPMEELDPAHSCPEGYAAQVIDTVRARGNAYGTPSENHQTTADLMSAWLSRRLGMTITLSAEDVCIINIIQKVSRLANVSKDDTVLDIAGYAENIGMLKHEQRNAKSGSKHLDRVGLNATRTEAIMADVKIGSVVRLRAGTTDMTVEGIDTGLGPVGTVVKCVWFDAERQLHRSGFLADQLVLVRE